MVISVSIVVLCAALLGWGGWRVVRVVRGVVRARRVCPRCGFGLGDGAERSGCLDCGFSGARGAVLWWSARAVCPAVLSLALGVGGVVSQVRPGWVMAMVPDGVLVRVCSVESEGLWDRMPGHDADGLDLIERIVLRRIRHEHLSASAREVLLRRELSRSENVLWLPGSWRYHDSKCGRVIPVRLQGRERNGPFWLTRIGGKVELASPAHGMGGPSEYFDFGTHVFPPAYSRCEWSSVRYGVFPLSEVDDSWTLEYTLRVYIGDRFALDDMDETELPEPLMINGSVSRPNRAPATASDREIEYDKLSVLFSNLSDMTYTRSGWDPCCFENERSFAVRAERLRRVQEFDSKTMYMLDLIDSGTVTATGTLLIEHAFGGHTQHVVLYKREGFESFRSCSLRVTPLCIIDSRRGSVQLCDSFESRVRELRVEE